VAGPPPAAPLTDDGVLAIDYPVTIKGIDVLAELAALRERIDALEKSRKP
jgi:hypothetical protein